MRQDTDLDGDKRAAAAERSDGMDEEELAANRVQDVPAREVLSVVSPNANAALGLEMAEDVPAADEAPVGGRMTIQPVDDEKL